MENTAKAIEYINHHLMADYLEKLTRVQMGRVVLFTTFPVTGAPNISDPKFFVQILNPKVISDLLLSNLN